MNWKENIRRLMSWLLVNCRLTRVTRRHLNNEGSLILCGHRVGPDDGLRPKRLGPNWLKGQLAYLQRSFHPIPLTRLLEWFEGGLPVYQRSVVLSFDDGFRDNYEYLFPLVVESEIPCCIFLTTECIDTGRLPWPQRLSYILMKTDADCCRHQGLFGVKMKLSTLEHREAAWRAGLSSLRRKGKNERDRVLIELEEELGVIPPGDAMLSWDEAREMQTSGLVEFGAHTYSHPWMEYLPEEEARWEMERSKADLRAQLGIENPPFCFPGGSYTPRLVEMAKQLGFRSVFQSRPALRYNCPNTTNQFALSRIGLPIAPAYILEAELDGPLHAIRQLYRLGR